MYFAWLGFYTTSMLYPAVIGFVLWMLTETDQVTIQEDYCSDLTLYCAAF